jgi:hypothetical protein
MRTRLSRIARTHRRALIPLLLAGALSLGATAASALPASSPRSIPDSAFQPVTLEAAAAPSRDAAPRLGRGGPVRAPDAAPIADPWLLPDASADRARPDLPAPKAIAVQRPTATSVPRPTGHSISGRASWYCDAGVSSCTVNHPDGSGFDAYAAAGPRLRAAIGSGWRGMVVTVDGIRVKLIDWCQCYQGESNEKLLDLYHDVFLRTGSAVTIRW